MTILFLDFDGVLHPEHCHESRHFSLLPIFEDVVRNVPNIELVIASTWRMHASLEDLRNHFTPDVAARIVGITPQFTQLQEVPNTLLSYEREAECHAWLWAHQIPHAQWLAVDDRSWLYRPFCKSLFIVNGKTGLTPAAGEQLSSRLRLFQ